MQVTEVEDDMFVWCDGRNGRKRINTMLINAVQPGDWLLIHLDIAREAIDVERATLINSALDGLERVAAGQDNFEECFADLINREPQLPDFLRTDSVQKEKL